jgi:hypothetical protein
VKKLSIDSNNYTIGGIELYYSATINDADLDNGATDGIGYKFRTTNHNLGNIVTSEFNPEMTYLEHFIVSSDGDQRKDHVVTSSKTMTIPFTFDEMNEANMRRYFQGDDISASMSTATPGFTVMSNVLEYGSAQIYFRTDIGNDLVYMIPKCTLRPDGAMAMNTEDWWNAPMVLEVLHNDWTPSNIASETLGNFNAPYGLISMTSID